MEKKYKIYSNKTQLRVTLPKVLAQALGLKDGDDVLWSLGSNRELIIKKIE